MKKNKSIILSVIKNQTLIWRLGKNDLKTKFAGSYLGIIWAFVQPIITVLVYWFVFQVGLRSPMPVTKSGVEIPYVLWLVAGLVPWFFFADALNGGAASLTGYNYLVKKVVFEIEVLPVVRIISALFVHVFFVAFTLILFACNGLYPTWYSLQVVYYSFAMFVLVLGLSYMTSAIVVFFRDLTQIITILLQIGIWVTPIMWNINSMDVPPIVVTILKLNPMFYIVAGYRGALIDQTGFWESPGLTIYFWVVTILFFVWGSHVFKKLRVHFADVL